MVVKDLQKGRGGYIYCMKHSRTTTMERYRADSRRAPKVSNHVMCHMKFVPFVKVEGGGAVSARCIEQTYLDDNLDGRAIPIDGRQLGRWDEMSGCTYQTWVRMTVEKHRTKLVRKGVITETDTERYSRLRRKHENIRAAARAADAR